MGHSSKGFVCSRCNITRERIGEVGTCFEVRNTEALRAQAILWRDATSNSARKNITDTAGVRWSELWRLPYWDPLQQLVVDPMHCLLLGLVHHHFANIFPLLLKAAEVSAKNVAFEYEFKQLPSPADYVPIAGQAYFMTDAEAQQISEIHKMLRQPINTTDTEAEKAKLSQRLGTKLKICLMFVTDSLALDTATAITKQDYARALVTWVRYLSC